MTTNKIRKYATGRARELFLCMWRVAELTRVMNRLQERKREDCGIIGYSCLKRASRWCEWKHGPLLPTGDRRLAI